MHEHQEQNLAGVFYSFPYSVSTELEIMKQEISFRVVAELEEQEYIVESRSHPGTPVYLAVNERDVLFVARPFLFRAQSRIDITVPCASGSLSMRLSHPNK